jgi:hypothetical protein
MLYHLLSIGGASRMPKTLSAPNNGLFPKSMFLLDKAEID